MILINLLPHREAARRHRRERFKRSLGLAIGAGALVAGALHLALAARVDAQRARNDVLRAQIAGIDAQIKEVADLQREMASLSTRRKAVEDLQSDRNMPVHLLNELAQQLPEGVYLTSLRQDPQTVLVQGVAQSSERVSELLRRFTHHSAWLSQPELVEIVSAQMALSPREQRRVANFQIRVRLRRAIEAQDAPSAPRASLDAPAASASGTRIP